MGQPCCVVKFRPTIAEQVPSVISVFGYHGPTYDIASEMIARGDDHQLRRTGSFVIPSCWRMYASTLTLVIQIFPVTSHPNIGPGLCRNDINDPSPPCRVICRKFPRPFSFEYRASKAPVNSLHTTYAPHPRTSKPLHVYGESRKPSVLLLATLIAFEEISSHSWPPHRWRIPCQLRRS